MFKQQGKKGVRSKFLERRAARERIQGFLDFSPSRIITRLSRTILLLRPLINTRRRWITRHIVCTVSVPAPPLERFHAFHTRGIRRCIKLLLALDSTVPPSKWPGNTRSLTEAARRPVASLTMDTVLSGGIKKELRD